MVQGKARQDKTRGVMDRAAQDDIGTIGRVVMLKLFKRSVDLGRGRDGQVCEVGRSLRGSGRAHLERDAVMWPRAVAGE